MLEELKPIEQHRIMDLIAAAGMDIGDWKNFKGGADNAASNPKYCYEWSFVEPKKLVILNLWYEELQEENGQIFRNLNIRRSAKRLKQVRQRRAIKLDVALQTAYRDKLPVRVVICDGKRRTESSDDASHVDAKLLDPVQWAVSSYDWNTGDCILTRGGQIIPFVDQFSITEELAQSVVRREITTQAFVRNPEVRRRALVRASGKCEWCAHPGFVMANGGIYLETHHIVPLAEDGSDSEANVIALCPNRHREAHHGVDRVNMRAMLIDKVVRR